jgi:hypothetical protein
MPLALGRRIDYFPRVPPRWKKLAIAAVLAPLSAGCAPESTLPQGTLVPTGIKLSPDEFLAGVPCGTQTGAMQSYVATLIDVSDALNPFVLPSSPPTPCAIPTDFRYLVVNDSYVAEIDGYTQPVAQLIPINGNASGSRHMLLDNIPVVPRWNGDCGAGPGNQAVASSDFDVEMRHCTPLRDLEGGVSTGIEIDPTSVLGDQLACGDAGGNVSYFTIKADDPTLPSQHPKTCTSDLLPIWLYDVGVVAGRQYQFEVTTKDVNNATIGTSVCTATALKGLITLAACTDVSR